MTVVARKLVLVMVALATAALPAAARAAQYTVHACDDAAGDENHAFYGATSDTRMSVRSLCTSDPDGNRLGVAAMAGLNGGPVPVFANATQSFIAPAGTTITQVRLRGDGRTINGDWAVLLQASRDSFTQSFWNLAGCSPQPSTAAGCTTGSPTADQNYDLGGATGFRSVVACGNYGNCDTSVTPSWPHSRAYYLMRRVAVTLDDASLPAIVLRGGGLAGGGWVRGTQSIAYSATDNSGIAASDFAIDELGIVEHPKHDCDYTFAVPCANLPEGSFSFDTSRVADGAHRLAVGAVDATGSNRAELNRVVLIDNHAPAAPLGPSVSGGDGWRTADGFSVRWTNPPSASPITRAFYELCRVEGEECRSGEQSGDGISSLSDVRVASPGDYVLRVWLADAAGNVSAEKSLPLHLRFDNVAPGAAQPRARTGWINGGEAQRFDQVIDPPLNPPASGIAGYAVTVDGSEPGTTIDVPANGGGGTGHKLLIELPEGSAVVKARAISAAGIPSSQVGAATLHVDRTTPQLSIEGAPDADRWLRSSVSLRVRATDPGELSGMASSASGGAYIEIGSARWWGPRTDLRPDGLLTHAAFATADLSIGEDGVHRIAYRAFDAAGNGTPQQLLGFKIDRTPPELAVFEPQRRSDPRLIEVAAADRTSGLADGGVIRLRRVSPAEGPWVTLETARQGNRYLAHVQNATLPAGDYELRATISDQAGNQTEATQNRSGGTAIVHITPTQVGPFPTDGGGGPKPGSPEAPDAGGTVGTRLRASLVEPSVVRKKCKRRAGRKRCRRTVLGGRLVRDLRLGYGKTAMARGTLATGSGAPLRHARVTVLSRPAMAGGRYRAVGAFSTDAHGAFSYRASAGPSRTLDFHFAGDRKYKHSDALVRIRVRAGARISVNRHSVRNGASVRFSGRLPGRPYPGRGKVLDLQAFYRGRWRTFATPRASRTGRWRYTYRFQATRGTVTYKFRVRVPDTSDYPYELGYSNTTRVRVRG